MADWLIGLVARLLEFIVLAAVIAIAFKAMLMLLSGPSWASILFQLNERPEVRRPLISSALVIGAIGFVSFESAGFAAAALAWMVVAPRYVACEARRKAWAADDAVTKAEALEVRNRLRELRQEEALAGDAPWTEYILDVAKAKRQRVYQQRFERAGGEEAKEAPVAPATSPAMGFHSTLAVHGGA